MDADLTTPEQYTHDAIVVTAVDLTLTTPSTASLIAIYLITDQLAIATPTIELPSTITSVEQQSHAPNVSNAHER